MNAAQLIDQLQRLDPTTNVHIGVHVHDDDLPVARHATGIDGGMYAPLELAVVSESVDDFGWRSSKQALLGAYFDAAAWQASAKESMRYDGAVTLTTDEAQAIHRSLIDAASETPEHDDFRESCADAADLLAVRGVEDETPAECFVVEVGRRGHARCTDRVVGPFDSYDAAEAYAKTQRSYEDERGERVGGEHDVWASVTQVEEAPAKATDWREIAEAALDALCSLRDGDGPDSVWCDVRALEADVEALRGQ